MLNAITFYTLFIEKPDSIPSCDEFRQDFLDDDEDEIADFEICGIKLSKKNKKKSIHSLSDNFYNSSKGSLTAAFLGNAIGAPLEYRNHVTESMAEDAFNLPGGGINNLKPGQLASDGELAVSLMRGLILGKGKYSPELIVKEYQQWLNSKPSELTSNLRNSFGPLESFNINYKEMPNTIKALSLKFNGKNQSNSGFLRMVPLAVWSARLQNEGDIENVVREEISLTSPNKIVIDAAICYCLAIRHLIMNKEDHIGAFELVDKWIKKNGEESGIEEWWAIVQSNELVDANVDQTSLKIAWTYAFSFLKEWSSNFNHILKKILEQGGDTDTNAGIVGGLLGALIGYNDIYESNGNQISIMLNCEVSHEPNPRPKAFEPKSALIKIDKLIDLAPKILIHDH